MPNLEIICVGNELLIGKTLNTNAHWLAKRITSLGFKVRRINVVSDDLDEIAESIRESIKRKPTFIIITGGLGPTFDDITLEGIAKSFNLKIEQNKDAMEMIKKKYETYAAEEQTKAFEMTPARTKMANLPEGSKPINNPQGTAPAVILRNNDTEIIALPGVPEEMKAIFEESITAILQNAASDAVFYETNLNVIGIPESELAPLIDRTMHDNHYVYIKSHPRISEKTPRIELHISTVTKNSEIAQRRIGSTIVQISELIREKNGKITPARNQK